MQLGVIGLAFSQFFAGYIVFLILLILYMVEYEFSFSKRILMESLRISYLLTPRIFFGVFGTQLQKYMIGLLSSTAGVGLYHIGEKFSNMVFIFMTALQNVFNPVFYKMLFSDSKYKLVEIGQYLEPYIYVSFGMGLLLSLFADEVLHIFTAEEYHGAANIVSILSVYSSLLIFGKFNGIRLIYLKRTFLTSIFTMLNIIIAAAISIPLILNYGADGAAWGALLSIIVTSSISFSVGQRLLPIKWRYKKLSILFIVFFGSILSVILLRYFDSDYFLLLIIKTVSIILFIYLGHIYKYYDYAKIKSSIQNKFIK